MAIGCHNREMQDIHVIEKPLVFLLSRLSINAVDVEDSQSTVKNTLANRPEVNAVTSSRFSPEQDLRTTRDGYLPSLDSNARTERKNVDDTATRAIGHNNGLAQSPNEVIVSLEQDVLNGFATNSEVARQKATVDSRAYSVMNASEDTAYAVIQTYFNVLQREEFMRLTEGDLTSREHIYDQIKLRAGQGIGRFGGFIQTETRLAQARNNLLAGQTSLEGAKITFVSATGMDPQGSSWPESIDSQLPTSLEGVKSRVEKNNPLLKSASTNTEVVHQQYEASGSTFYPCVDVEFSHGVSGNTDTTRAHTGRWETTVRLHYNLRQSDSDKANVSSRTYLHRQAQDIRSNTLRQLNQELHLAWTTLQNVCAQLSSAEEYADHSVRVRTTYQDQFSLDGHVLLDLLDSENEVFSSERHLVELRYPVITSGCHTSERTGKLMNILETTSPPSGQPVDSTEEDSLPELH